MMISAEYMSGGSVYDYLHKQKSVLKLPMLLRVAIDVSKGMDYLHQNKIIHRDLKAANLLMNENEVSSSVLRQSERLHEHFPADFMGFLYIFRFVRELNSSLRFIYTEDCVGDWSG